MVDKRAVIENAIAFFDLFLISLMCKLGHLERFFLGKILKPCQIKEIFWSVILALMLKNATNPIVLDLKSSKNMTVFAQKIQPDTNYSDR